MRCELEDKIKMYNNRTQKCEDSPCQWSPHPFSYNFYKLVAVLIRGETFKTNPFNSNDTEGAYRATSAIPNVSEIGRTHCNFDSLKNPFVICTSRWGVGANDYEQTYIADHSNEKENIGFSLIELLSCCCNNRCSSCSRCCCI